MLGLDEGLDRKLDRTNKCYLGQYRGPDRPTCQGSSSSSSSLISATAVLPAAAAGAGAAGLGAGAGRARFFWGFKKKATTRLDVRGVWHIQAGHPTDEQRTWEGKRLG